MSATKKRGAVSEETALEMSKGALEKNQERILLFQ